MVWRIWARESASGVALMVGGRMGGTRGDAWMRITHGVNDYGNRAQNPADAAVSGFESVTTVWTGGCC